MVDSGSLGKYGRYGQSGRYGQNGRRSRVQLDRALALVTGAGNGIGKETAKALARRGARVLVTDIDQTAAENAAEEIGGLAHHLDVSDRRSVLELAEEVRADYGPVDVLVNNAGVGLSGPFVDTSLEDWDWIIGVNFLGIVNCCSAFGPGMLERGRGHVVNVSSGLGYFPTATEAAYASTKAAVLALSRSLRADWKARGVGVSAICPGLISTGILTRTRFRGESGRPERVEQLHQLFSRRGHPPQRVAEAIVGAIEHDRPVVPVGVEAWLGWMVRGLIPSRLGDKLASPSARYNRTSGGSRHSDGMRINQRDDSETNITHAARRR
jgi:2-hydroxycyclohexanecarboxyl-CoA dehydrogenase